MYSNSAQSERGEKRRTVFRMSPHNCSHTPWQVVREIPSGISEKDFTWENSWVAPPPQSSLGASTVSDTTKNPIPLEIF